MVADCETLHEVRENIDRIDRQIVALVAEREQFVGQAARFKPSADAVFDEVRFNRIIAKVRSLAEEHGANADIVESVYRAMVIGFTEWEKGLVRERR